MKYRVYFSPSAENDLRQLASYITINDSREKAELLLDQIISLSNTLESLPSRGHYPPEFLEFGVKDYREIHLKPYRIIYQIEPGEVVIYAILDERRHLSELLQNRLLGTV